MVDVEHGLKVVRDAPLDAVNLGVDRAGNLLVLSMAGKAGTVYTFKPDGPRDALTVLEPQPRPASAETTFLLPSTVWADGQFRSHLDLATYEYETLAEMFAREVSTAQPKAYVRRTAPWRCRPSACSRRALAARIRAWTRPAGGGRTLSTRSA